MNNRFSELDYQDEALESYFTGGVAPEDIPAFYSLRRAGDALGALKGLFGGSPAAVLVRLLMLRELGVRADSPHWTAQEVRAHFAFLEETHRETVLARLRDFRLIAWDEEARTYAVTSIGRMALAAVQTLLRFAEEEDGDLGYLTAQIAGGAELGLAGAEELSHLLSRLNELQYEFDEAVLSGSELRIRNAAEKLESVWRWVSKGTEVIRRLGESESLEWASHRIAQRIGLAQSRMLNQASIFQRTLNQIEQNRFHLGQSGLSVSDVVAWLRDQSAEAMVALARGVTNAPVSPVFTHGPTAMDVAEYELYEREREDAAAFALPKALPPQRYAETEAAEREDLLEHLTAWLPDLRAITTRAPLPETVVADSFRDASYRLSLLSLLGDGEHQALEGPVAELAHLPLGVELTGGCVEVGRGEVSRMSEGDLVPSRNRQDG